MVMPPAAKSRMTFRTSPTISGSRALVGSSKSMISGSMQRARAMATRCFCPPESLVTGAWAKSRRPTSARCFFARSSAWALLHFFKVTGASVQLSSTFMLLNRLKPWKTMPMLSRRRLTLTCSAARSSPWNHTCPASGVSSRLMQRSRVDLPEPEGPMMVTTSPGMTEKSTPRSTTLDPKLFSMPSTRMRGSLAPAAPAVAATLSLAMFLLPSSLVLGRASIGTGAAQNVGGTQHGAHAARF